MSPNSIRKLKWAGVGSLLALILNWGGPIGCGGSSGSGTASVNVGKGTGHPAADTSQAISSAMGSAFQGLSAGIANSSQTVTCNTGNIDVSGNASGGNPVSFDLTASFNDCMGLDGHIDMSGQYSSSPGGDFQYNFAVDGTVGGHGCALEFDAFGAEISGNANAFTFLLTGNVAATCGSATVTCNYNGINSQDLTALQAACNCSGTGC